MRRRLLIGLSILAACAFAGGAYAASNSTSPKQAFLNDLAGRLHVSPQQLQSAIQGAVQDRLNAAVKAGKLTQAQANAIEKRLREGGVPAFPFLGPGLLPFRRGLLPFRRGVLPFRPGFSPRGPGFMFRVPLLAGGPLVSAGRYIGITLTQLFKQLGSGKSLAQIATAHGKTVTGLENAIVSAERSRLDKARQGGLITSAQEQQVLSRLTQRVGKLVDRRGFGAAFGPLAGPPPSGPFGAPRKGRFGSVPPGFPAPAAPGSFQPAPAGPQAPS